MKYVYFDYNIIRYLEEKKLNLKGLLEKLDSKTSNLQVVYSPAHIEEMIKNLIDDGVGEDTIKNRLKYIEKITRSKAILPYSRESLKQEYIDGAYLSEESPLAMYERLLPTYGQNETVTSHQKQKIENGKINEKNTGITSKEANNTDIKKTLEDNKANLIEIIHHGVISASEEHNIPIPNNLDFNNFCFDMYKKCFLAHEAAIEKIFEEFELRRYFPEKDEKTSTYDVTHAVYASFCDILVTSDKRFLKKAEAAFDWYGVKTKITKP